MGSISRFEIKQHLKMLLIWLSSVTAFVFLIILMYPQMSGQMAEMRDLFKTMSIFTQALNISDLQFDSVFGFYSMELENSAAMALAILACYLGGQIVSKEEINRTGEFLYSQPLSRSKAFLGKSLAAVILLTGFNAAFFVTTVLSTWLTQQTMPWDLLAYFHLALLLMQIFLCLMAIGLSGFNAKLATGLSVGLALLFFAFDIIANLMDQAEWLRFLSPFSFIKAATIIDLGQLDWPKVASNLAVTLAIYLAGYFIYQRRDLEV